MCQNTKNMKITPVTDICSKGDSVKKRVLTPSLGGGFTSSDRRGWGGR